MKSKIKNWIFESRCGGSILACVNDIRSLSFNIRASVLHAWNYTALSRKPPPGKLHFGCGKSYKVGYLNLDFYPPADVYLDARNRCPFPSGSIQEIYSSHFVEHLSNDELLRHLKEAHRMLAPSGTYRICVPDFRKTLAAYLSKDSQYLDLIKSMSTLKGNQLTEDYVSYGDYLDKALHESGKHKVFLDEERMVGLLRFSGFDGAHIKAVDFDPMIDAEDRRLSSFYMVARKS